MLLLEWRVASGSLANPEEFALKRYIVRWRLDSKQIKKCLSPVIDGAAISPQTEPFIPQFPKRPSMKL